MHRLFKGAEFPTYVRENIAFNKKWETLEVVFNKLDDETIQHEVDPGFLEKKYAVAVIKRFSKKKDIKKIREFVEENYIRKETLYVLRKPGYLIELIQAGIKYFSE